ncbi:hypothetical protein [Fuchsiella alkaliacetigena]|uniref:hypothetical protein n=1 Tax=Fuchsiella alkaliacetigena TaxID=957042 RepID=UPI00200AA79D|nr:hypothetical protein [Fuchsiella alkaliacetigena]MCK8824443.1 hypothetical protein [Fuchsiella alkaliacetigena]
MDKSNKVVPLVFLGVMVIVLTVVITLTVSNNGGTEVSPQEEQVAQQEQVTQQQDQTTMNLTQEQRRIFEDITKSYICNCGNCEDMVLYECDCSTPQGAQELHEFIVHYLNEGKSQAEIDDLLHQNYDMKANPNY